MLGGVGCANFTHFMYMFVSLTVQTNEYMSISSCSLKYIVSIVIFILYIMMHEYTIDMGIVMYILMTVYRHLS